MLTVNNVYAFLVQENQVVKITFRKTFVLVGLGASSTMPLTSLSEDQAPLKAEYIGVENCRLCHMPHYESWSETKMSKSYELLKPNVRAEAKLKAGFDPAVDYSTNEACLNCHVTGFKEPGGFVSIEETPEMVGVQCESCHGPGSIYTEMMIKKQGTFTLEDYRSIGGLTMPSEENNVCTDKCHNPSSPFTGSGYVFDFEDRKASGTHRHDLEYIYMPFDL